MSRPTIAAIFAVLAAGIIVPPLLTGDTNQAPAEWTLLPAAKAPWLVAPSPSPAVRP